jgi:hypothetical protein
MRFAALALMASVTTLGAGACSLTSSGSECHSDVQCGDDVCARSGECLARTSVREVTVKWTVNGESASAASCATHPDLYIQFYGADYGDTLRLPVSCRDGSYSAPAVPKRYVQIELGVDGGTGDLSPIDPSGRVQLDLLQ